MTLALHSLRTLHPIRQWESGIGFIQYLAALITSFAGLCMLAARRSGAAEVFGLAIVLWACAVVGGMLTAVLNEETPTDELRRELQELHDRSLAQGRTVPQPKDQPMTQDGREGPWMATSDADESTDSGHAMRT